MMCSKFGDGICEVIKYKDGLLLNVHALNPACIFKFDPVDPKYAERFDLRSFSVSGMVGLKTKQSPGQPQPDGVQMLTAEQLMSLIQPLPEEPEEEEQDST